MAKKIGVLDVHQCVDARPQTYVKKTVARLLIRRLLAEWVVENATIRRLAIPMHQNPIPGHEPIAAAWKPREYAHHLEPKVHQFTLGDSEWMRYLYGYSQP